ncbi:MAG TPA: amidohydrolase family protein [Acidimicrobiia bacterium]|nr:amidohydrolase family protein [Acidimicrobiia bacterium]
MIDDAVVLDAVIHAYNFSPENQKNPELCSQLGGMLYGLCSSYAPRTQPEYTLDVERFMAPPDPDLIAHALFAESPTDIAIYHDVPQWGLLEDGGSPIWVGQELRERYPGRFAIYGAVAPWTPGALDRIDWLAEEVGVVGLKLYPLDVVDGTPMSYRMDDPEACFPLLERAQQRGIRSVAVHKALPLGPMPLDPFRVDDLEGALAAFPDLCIEIVHGGMAFLEETAMLIARFPNAVVNLEGASAFLPNMPMKFAEVLGTFLSFGAEDRVVWATGCMAFHPRPLVEKFWNFEFPELLVEGYGVPPLTREIKKKILAENAARILGLDLKQMQADAGNDEFAGTTSYAPPWSGGRVATAVA